jgi:hypothetical protein
MIVKSFEEAKPIVLVEQAKGKKVGFWTITGPSHPGYLYLGEEMRKYCDYSVCQVYPIVTGRDDLEVQLVSEWGVSFAHLPPGKPMAPETLKIAEESSDLVINAWRPIPTGDRLAEAKAFTEKYHDPRFKSLDPTYDPTTFNGAYWASAFATMYSLNKYYFPLQARTTSYKEGHYRLVHGILFRELGTEYVCIPPLRDEYGIAYSASLLGKDEAVEELRRVLDGKPLITSKDATKESLQSKLDGTEWRVLKVDKYSGEILKHHTDAVLIETMIAWGKVPGIPYSDCFIL